MRVAVAVLFIGCAKAAPGPAAPAPQVELRDVRLTHVRDEAVQARVSGPTLELWNNGAELRAPTSVIDLVASSAHVEATQAVAQLADGLVDAEGVRFQVDGGTRGTTPAVHYERATAIARGDRGIELRGTGLALDAGAYEVHVVDQTATFTNPKTRVGKEP